MPTTEPDPNGLATEAPSVPGYQITALRRSSSMTDEWDALQLSLERTVSMITPRADRLGDAAWCDRFEELSRDFARLHHRNFLQVIDTARTAEGVPYVVVERLEGESLATVLLNEGPFAPDRAARIVMQLADALDNAWKQSGFVLRNLKPENLVLLSGDVVKITAFLYATIVRPGADPLAGDGGELVGTPHYMPPEQIDALRTIDFHADMYAVGSVFYRMLTGRSPFEGTEDAMEILRLQKEGTLPAPSDANPAIPAGFSHVLLRMMAKRPADRYPYWQDVVEDLQRVLSGRDPFLPVSPGGGAWVPPASTIAPAAPPPPGGKLRLPNKGRAGVGASPAGGRKVIAFDRSMDPAMVRNVALLLQKELSGFVLAGAYLFDGKPNLVLMYTADLVAAGKNAGKDIREAAKFIQGGGGGQPGLATAGGKNPDGLKDALEKLIEIATA